MGCDIHVILEEQDIDGTWIAINTFKSHDRAPWTVGKNVTSLDLWSSPIVRDRNYDRFAKLADVRSYETAGPKPRGLPKDVSQTTQFLVDKWDVDGHSHSWLPLKEAVKIWVETEHNALCDKWFAKCPEYHYFGVRSLTEEGFDRYRVVFWFDN